MKFRELFIVFALIGIFILCMVNFGVHMAHDNESNNTILNNQMINESFGSGLEANLSRYQSQAESQKEGFEKDNPKVGAGFFMLDAIMGAGRVFTGMVVGVFNLILMPLESIIGIDKSILGIIFSILLVSIMLLAWRVYKAGD